MTNLFIVQRHGWMKTHDYISELITVNQSLHLTKDRFAWIILSYVILSELKENNRINLNHRFLHFVASLQSKFYTLAPTFAFDVNIFFSSSRLFTIDPSLSLLQAIHRQLYIEFSIVFTVTLASCYSCFK